MRTSPWSFICSAAAAAALTTASATFAQSCGDPAAGSCCIANGTAFCDDAACCELICGQDPFCCDVEWDGICANAALGQCEACGAQECIVDCLDATSEEAELCGEDTNGGCNPGSGLAEAADVGDVICGTYWADGGTRDTDWFEFTITENKVLTFSVVGEIQTNIFLVGASCPASVIASATGVPGSCDPVAIVDQCVPAGTYRVVVVPAFFDGFPCDPDPELQKRYQLSLIDTGLTCTAAPGDTCEDAIPTTEGDTAFDNNGSFTNGDPLPPECDSFGTVTMFNDIWFSFTATQDSLYRISTCNQASFDTRLAIYEGSCGSLSILACNDDGAGCAGFTSEMLVQLTSGTEYFVRVGAFGAGGFGSGTLTIAAVEGCDVTCPEGAYVETELCGEDTNGGCNGGGIYEDVPAPTTICGTFFAAGGTRDTDWYRFNLAESANVTLTVNSTLNVTIGLLSADCAPLIYVIDATQSCGATVTACLPAGESVAFIALANFDSPACGSGELNQYTATISIGDPCVPLVCGNPDAGDCCVANGTPFCDDEECCDAICAFDPFCCDTAWDQICADAANSQCVVCGVEPLPNDECSGAVAIFDGVTDFTTNGASTSEPPLDPSCDEGFGTAFVNDIWFTYTATCTDDVTFSTCGIVNFDTRLALYSGTCDNLTLVACNDDGPGCPGFSSEMVASLVEGQTYFLRVGGFGGSGSGSINIFCGGGGGGPENDECDGALPLSAGPNSFSTIGATGTTQMDPGACTFFGSSVIFNDVWFTWTATGDGEVEISTCASASFDTRIAVFSDCSLSQTIACNDDATGCGLTSRVTFATECGVTYYVSLGAFGAAQFGTGTVTVTQSGTCPQPCPADLSGNGDVGPEDLALLLGQWGGAGSGDLSGNGSVGPEDLALLLGAWGPC